MIAALLIVSAVFARDDGTCHAWRAAAGVGTLENASLVEVSGLAASHAQPGVLWAHNDHGTGPYVFALGLDGSDRGSFGVLGATNTDWEDVALGPCAAGESCSCLYIGDFGNNDLARATGIVWRFPEPGVGDGTTVGQTAVAEALHFTYPDGRHDAEALLVHPDTGQILVLTKAEGAETLVFAFPEAPSPAAPESDPIELEQVASLRLEDSGGDSDKITGGVVSPRGDRVFLRSDSEIYLFSGGDADLVSVLGAEAVRLPSPKEAGNAEALTISPDGVTLYMAGEGGGSTLFEVECASFESDGGGSDDPLVDCADDDTDDTGLLVDGTCGCGAKETGLAGVLAPWSLSVLLLGRRRRAFRSR